MRRTVVREVRSISLPRSDTRHEPWRTPDVRHATSREDTMRAIARACLAGVVALALLGTAGAQDPESSRLAKQLAAALEAAKVDSIAARDPTHAGTYIAALYVSGTQLLVISA